MGIDPLAPAMQMMAARTQQSIAVAVMRTQHQMDQQVVQMIDEVTRAAPPPPGQGTRVDKTA